VARRQARRTTTFAELNDLRCPSFVETMDVGAVETACRRLSMGVHALSRRFQYERRYLQAPTSLASVFEPVLSVPSERFPK